MRSWRVLSHEPTTNAESSPKLVPQKTEWMSTYNGILTPAVCVGDQVESMGGVVSDGRSSSSSSVHHQLPEPPHHTAPPLGQQPTVSSNRMLFEWSAAAAIATDNGDDAVAVSGTKS